MKRELTQDEFDDILWDGLDYEEVTEEKIVDKRRWTISLEQIFRKTSDDTYWKVSWMTGSTENQEGPQDFFIEEVVPTKVEAIQYLPKV